MTVILKFKGLSLTLAAVFVLSMMLMAPKVQASDPTQPDVQLSHTTPALGATAPALPKLQMIRSQGASQQALIDGQWRKVGEKMGGYRVRTISASQVTLQQGERNLVLQLYPNALKIRDGGT